MINIEELKNKITFADCFEIMQQLPDKCIDLAFIDPPYGKKCDGGSYGFGLTPKQYQKKKWDEKIPDKKVFDEIFRVSKNQIIFGGNYFSEYLPPTNAWVVWDKVSDYNFKNDFSQCELLWTSYSFAVKKFIFVQQGFVNGDPAEALENRWHPTKKPLKLAEMILLWLLQTKRLEGDALVADFYSGSGTFAIACHNLGLDFIATENDTDYYPLSVARLEKAQAQQKLNLWGC